MTHPEWLAINERLKAAFRKDGPDGIVEATTLAEREAIRNHVNGDCPECIAMMDRLRKSFHEMIGKELGPVSRAAVLRAAILRLKDIIAARNDPETRR